MNNNAKQEEVQEVLDYHVDQLKTIRQRNKELEIELSITIDEAKMFKRERNFLLPLVIALVLWVVAS